jgi:unsaturated rhamnogalacturonyl hydrolase
VTGKEKYLKACHQLYAQLQKHPRTNEGGFWHKKIYPYQMWLDGLYMGQPFYAEYASLMNIPSAFDDIANQFSYMEKNARDPKTGLLYHGWDESRKERWSNPKTGLSPHFWARGMGWYVMALVDVLDYFPENHPRRQELISILNRTLSAIVKYQDPKTGVWYDIVDLGTRKGNYLESSASSMFVFALAKSLRKGYIPVSYQKNLDRGYQGLVKEFITPVGENRVNLTKTVQVSGLGGKKYRDGSFEYYMSEPVITNDPKGVGAFILAASEVEFNQEKKGKKQRTVTLDNYFNNEYKKTASGQLKPYHYLWDGDDNNGFSLLGRIFEKNGGQLNTLTTAPTRHNLSKSSIYIIVDPDT